MKKRSEAMAATEQAAAPRKRSEAGPAPDAPLPQVRDAEAIADKAKVDMTEGLGGTSTASDMARGMRVKLKDARIDAADPGDVITVTRGAERYCPVKYNGFDVGPVSVTVTVREGESHAEAYMRATATCDVLMQVEFDIKLKEFRDRLEKGRAAGL